MKKIMVNSDNPEKGSKKENPNWMEEENEEAELTVDVYQTRTEIVIQTMVAGVKPDDLDVHVRSISFCASLSSSRDTRR